MAITNYYILTEEQYQKLLNQTAVAHTYDKNAIYYTDKISADLIDDRNSTKKMVTTSQVERWTEAVGAQADWNETDTEKKSYIKNKPVIPEPDPRVNDVMISKDGQTYTSIVTNKIAKLDLSENVLHSELKTINGEQIWNTAGGNILIDSISYIDCRTSTANQPTSENTSGLLKIVLTSPTTENAITYQKNYWYINLES